MTTLDPRALKAARSAYQSAIPDGCWHTDGGETDAPIRAAITAYLALSQPQAGEPVAWHHRIWFEDRDCWSKWRDGRHDEFLANKWEERPLYASPQPANPAQVTDAARELWYDATNAVCQTMQERGMCNCSDGDCVAAKVDPAKEDIANFTAAIGAGGQAVAVKPLEWEPGVVDWAKPLPGMKYVACSTTPAGAWAWWLDDAPETRAVFASETEAKAAAQSDYEQRLLSALSQPHPADERVVEALVQATRKYTRETLFIDEHRDLIRATLEKEGR